MSPEKILFAFVVVGCAGAVVGAIARYVWLGFKSERIARNPDTTRRAWRAYSPSGSVPLGDHLTYAEALKIAQGLGTVSWADRENGFIFFNTHLGGDTH